MAERELHVRNSEGEWQCVRAHRDGAVADFGASNSSRQAKFNSMVALYSRKKAQLESHQRFSKWPHKTKLDKVVSGHLWQLTVARWRI